MFLATKAIQAVETSPQDWAAEKVMRASSSAVSSCRGLMISKVCARRS
ncbi:MAG: hypothetical protein CM1200mP2_48020 [Planctomycetaceae bacterium]|nr:MAG: hypothetical protein CM1200mP2_48020 [Planctomycetaceae bacterium]